MRHTLFLLIFIALISPVLCAGGSGEETEQVNVYSHRHYDADQKLFDQFTAETGIQVHVVKAGADELIERLRAEGERSPADFLITVDVSRLYRAKQLGLFQAVSSPLLNRIVPAHLRDPDGYWYALTKRARVIVVDRSRRAVERMDYEDLAHSALDGTVLIRSSSNVYNISLLASIIAHNGETAARSWAQGVVAHMARPPQGNDRDQMKALVAGVGDYAVVNTYYIGLLRNSDDPAEQAVGEKIGVIFPNQDNRGTHVNVSGAGVTRHAPNRDNALRLMEFLLSEEAQKVYAEQNYEYPVNPNVVPGELVRTWGTFIEDSLKLNEIGREYDQALRIFDSAGWK